METLIVGEIRRNENGATHAQMLARVSPVTMLSRKVFALTLIDLQRRGIVETASCAHRDHDPRYFIRPWHGDLKPCCA